MQTFPGRSPSLAMAPQPRYATARLYEQSLEALTRIPAGGIAATRAPGALPTGPAGLSPSPCDAVSQKDTAGQARGAGHSPPPRAPGINSPLCSRGR